MTPIRERLARAARWIPALAAAGAAAALFGAGAGCGKGLFSQATGSATVSPTPGPALFLYDSNFNDGRIAEFKRNTATGALSLLGGVAAGAAGGPMGLVVTPDNRFLYAVNQADGKVYEFALRADGTLGKIPPGSVAAGRAPQMIAVDSSQSWAYATNLGSGSISEYSINSSSGALTSIGSAPGPAGPFGAAAHPSGPFLYVADNKGGLIWSFTINSSTGALTPLGAPLLSLGSSAGSPGLMAIAADSPANIYLFVADVAVGMVSEFTIASNGTLAFGGVFGLANSGKPIGIGLATNLGTNYLYLANSAGDSISYFSRFGPGLTLLSALAGPNAPTGLVTDPQGKFVYTGDFGDGTVAQFQINGSCGAPLCSVATYPTENPPNPGAGAQFLALTH